MRKIGARLRALLAVPLLVLAAGVAAQVAFVPVARAAADMTLSQFVSTYEGKTLGDGQCVEVFKAYDIHVVGGNGPATGGTGGADEYWYDFTADGLASRYTKIPTSQPAKPGDVAIWGGGEDGYGHVAIVLSSAPANPGSLYVLSQNPGPAKPQTIKASYNYGGPAILLGYLRPNGTLPAEPTSVKVSSIAARSAVLTWHDASNNESGFVAQFKVAGASSWTRAAQSAGVNKATMTVTGLIPGKDYIFQVGSWNSAGTHWSAYAYGNTPQVLPAEPGTPRVTWTTGTAAGLAWTDTSDNESGFRTQYKVKGATSWTRGPSASAGVTSATVGGLTRGTEYVFQVGSWNSAGTHWSAYFYGWTVPLPAEPTSVSAAMSSSGAALTWRDNSNNETGFRTQYKVNGASTWTYGPSAGANVTSVTVGGLSPSTSYIFQVGATNSAGTHWSPYAYGKTPAASPPPAYKTGHEVTIVSQATGGVSGHKGPANSYSAGPTHPANSAIWIVCYMYGQSIAGPYGTESVWDLGDDGYYYSDAWIWTGSNSPVVPQCSLRTVTVDSHATGGDSGHTGPGNAYAAGPTHAAGTPIQIACYVNGQSITGPYGTETIWDLGTDGYYYSDAWLWTGSNGAVVPAC